MYPGELTTLASGLTTSKLWWARYIYTKTRTFYLIACPTRTVYIYENTQGVYGMPEADVFANRLLKERPKTTRSHGNTITR